MVAGFKNQIRMRVLEGKELEDYLKQMQEWEAKKAKAIEDAFQREIVTGDDIVNILRTIQVIEIDGNYLLTLLRMINYLMKPLIKVWL